MKTIGYIPVDASILDCFKYIASNLDSFLNLEVDTKNFVLTINKLQKIEIL